MPGTWTRRCCALGLTLALSRATSAEEPPAPAAPAAQAPVIEAPRLISMPPIVVPPDVALPEDGRVEVTITVAADGGAALDQCEVAQPICDRVSEVLADAHFEPARREGTPVAARVKVALQLAPPPSAAAPVTTKSPSAPATDASPPSAATAPGAPAEPTETLSYGAKAQAHPVQPGARRLELAETRDLPGAFGDPFRAVDALPGVVPVLSGLPYFFIRGSPPAGTLYIYDDIPVPTLYHLAVGPAVIHPLMVGPITLYSGVAPARYGRLTGGVIVGEGPPAGDDHTHFETELRLLDVSGYLQTDALGGTVTAAVRYGYPALLFSIFSPRVNFSYWDYQLRYDVDLSPNLHFQLVSLGSYDSFGVSDEPGDAVTVQFHRVEPRLIYRQGKQEYGAALLFGYEESGLGSAFQLKATRIGPRLWFEQQFGDRDRLRVSADMQGINGDFSSVPLPGGINRRADDIGLVGDVKSRSIWGVAIELGLRPSNLFELKLGARADAWVQSGGAEAVADPRGRLILHASDTLDLHIAAGIVHQPAVFFVPLPGIADLANDRGLQSAIQTEAGVGWDTPLDLRVELQLFYHHYRNLVFTDTLLLRDAITNLCGAGAAIDCAGVKAPTRIDGSSYGFELFLRRPITESLSGFLSYTLAFSPISNVVGLHYTPSWDVRHVLNLVLQWQIGAGFSAGARAFVRSGKSDGEYTIEGDMLARIEERLPWFARVDLEAAYAWPTSWGRLRVALEWFNVSMSREPEGADCNYLTGCHTVYLPAIFLPNLSLRAEH